jgi:hypothetical protein
MPFLRKKNGIDLYGPKMVTIGTDGAINETVGSTDVSLCQLTIPAGTFDSRSCVKVKGRIIKTSTNGQTVITLRLGTGGTISDTLIGSYTATSSAHTLIPIERTFCVGAGSQENLDFIVNPNVSLSLDIFDNVSISAITYNRNVQNALTLYARNLSSTDTITGMYLHTKGISKKT